MKLLALVRCALIVRVVCLANQDYYYYNGDDDAYDNYLTSHVPKDWDIGQDYEVGISQLCWHSCIHYTRLFYILLMP